MARRRKPEPPGCLTIIVGFFLLTYGLCALALVLEDTAKRLHVPVGWAIVIILLSPAILYLAFLLLRTVIIKIVQTVSDDIRRKKREEILAPEYIPAQPKEPPLPPVPEPPQPEPEQEAPPAPDFTWQPPRPTPKPRIKVTVGIDKSRPRSRIGMGRQLDQCEPDCVALDISAIRNPAGEGELVEISAIKLRSYTPVDVFSTLIKPSRPLNSMEMADLGLTNVMLSKAPAIGNVMEALWDFLDGEVILSLNTQPTMFTLYDVLLTYTDHILSNNYLDIRTLAKAAMPDLEGERLGSIARRLGGPQSTSPRIMGICEIMVACYAQLAPMLQPAPDAAPEPEETPPPEPTQAGTQLDDLLIPAIDWILREKNPTTGALQKEFGIGYDKAKNLMNQIELLGVVGPPNGSKPREVLMGINPLTD